MISRFGKYIPIIFLITCVFVFLDGVVSFSQLRDVQTEQHTIFQTYERVYKIMDKPITLAQRSLLREKTSSFSDTLHRMYTTIILSSILNILLLIFAYIAIMRELRQRTLLERNKDEFISLTSHELRTPITTLNIFAGMLSKNIGKTKDKESLHILGKMQNQINEMKNLINDLLDVTRIQLGKFELQKEHFNFMEALGETIEDIQTTTKKHKIYFKGPHIVYVFADKQRMWQVVANLLNNAIKYSPRGGKIQVKVQKKTTTVTIVIKDYGIGISQENQSKIFNRYFREVGTEKDFSGLGLGLYLAKQIIHLHGGRIWVKSIPNKGSTFYFTLPIKDLRKRKK